MNELMRRMLFLPEQASTFALDVDRLHYFVITVTMVASLAVACVAIGFFWKYRRRRENQATPFIEPTPMFEVLAISVPLAFFLVWFAIGFRDFVKVSSPPPDAMDVYVQGKQWMWKFAYPEGPQSIGVMHIPANRPVRLLITSRDVIHSVFIPAFRIKMDALPGRYTEIWFTATKPGRYQILCAQWGKQVAVAQGCLRCHNVDTREPSTGPSWVDLYQQTTKLTDGREVIADEAYLTESMMEPTVKVVAGYQPLMPNYQGKLTGPEAAAIVEFIKSLRSDRTAQAIGGAEQ